MTSRDDVHRLRAEGLSVRQIAARLGLHRSKVYRWLVAGPVLAADEDGEPYEDDENLTPPFTFVGMDPEPTRPGRPIRCGARYVDSRGVSFDALALYRWRAHRDADGSLPREEHPTLGDQIAAGYVDVVNGDGYVYTTRAEWLADLGEEWRQPVDYSYYGIGPPPFV